MLSKAEERSPAAFPANARRAGSILAALCLGFVAYRLLDQAGSLPPVRWTWQAVGALSLSSVLVVGTEMVHSLAWRTLARGIDPRVSWKESFVLCGRSQLAKYLPSNVLHYVQRVVLTRRGGMSLAAGSALTVLDALVMLTAGCLVAVPAVGSAYDKALVARVNPSSAALMVAGLGALLLAVIAVMVVPRIKAVYHDVAGLLRPGRLVLALAIDVVPFVLAGLSVHLVLSGVWPDQGQPGWAAFIPGFALAFVLGFVTPGAPAGAGVRDFVLWALYAPTLGQGLAAGLFLLLRLSQIVGDVLTYAVASLVRVESDPFGRETAG